MSDLRFTAMFAFVSHRRSALVIALTLVSLSCRTVTDGGVARPAAASGAPTGERTAMILAINDVYRIEGLDDGAVGGFGRLRTLRSELEKDFPDLLFLHGGDFLFPSFASRTYRGEQMVAVMNALDGDTSAFDSRMFATFGNHEFDRPKLKDVSVLQNRVAESQFAWLGGNFTFVNGPDGKPLVASPHVSRTAIVRSGGLRIGLFGITIPTKGVEYLSDFAGEVTTARELTASLRAQGVDAVVAVTHLNASEDRDILETLGDQGPDLIIGGHDHEAMTLEVKGRFVLKADADARTATVARITRKADGRLVVTHELRKLTAGAQSSDRAVQDVVDQWQSRHAREFCAAAQASENCLDEVYGRSRTTLTAEENKIRGSETSLGDWVADRMLAKFQACGAQVAFVNSGSLRLNRDLPPGPVTRRVVEELFAYPAPVHLIRIDGATLRSVADHAVRGWPGSGTWLQIAGFAYRHDTKARTASDLTWSTGAARAITGSEPIVAVTTDYLVNPEAGDQDGYTMLNPGQIVSDCAVKVADLKNLMVDELRAAEPRGIAPVVEGRICQGVPGVPCSIPAR